MVLRGVPRVFRHRQPKHPVLVRLRDRSRLRADLVKRRTQLSQKVRAQLLRSFPAMWELAEDLSGLWGALFLTPWQRAPTPERAKRLRRTTLHKVLGRCRIRKRTVEDVDAQFHQPTLMVAPGVTEGAVEAIQMLVAQLRLWRPCVDFEKLRNPVDLWLAGGGRATARCGGVEETKTGEPLELPITRQLAALLERRRLDASAGNGGAHRREFPSTGGSGHVVELRHLYRRISRAAGARFRFHGLRNVFITVAERELMLPRSLTKRLVNHARGSDVTESCAADWRVEQQREPARRIADRIDEPARGGATEPGGFGRAWPASGTGPAAAARTGTGGSQTGSVVVALSREQLPPGVRAGRCDSSSRGLPRADSRRDPAEARMLTRGP